MVVMKCHPPPPPPPPPRMVAEPRRVHPPPPPPPQHSRQQLPNDDRGNAFARQRQRQHRPRNDDADAHRTDDGELPRRRQSLHLAAVPPPPPPPPPPPFGESPSYDSSDVGRSDGGGVGDGDASSCLLSPSLKSFLNTSHDAKGRNAANISDDHHVNHDNELSLSLNTSLFDESGADEGEGDGVLHSIFSPKFHAMSARKRSGRRPPPFSPASAASTRERDCCSRSLVSEMSDDDFGTINAILRGDTIESIKRHVGLDRDNHPLDQAKGGGGEGEGDAADDSTEDMLDKARALAGERARAQGDRRVPASPSAHVSPVSEEEFHTPAGAAPSPTALDFDGAGGTSMISGLSVLPPVWEDRELGCRDPRRRDDGESEGDGTTMDDFRTPKGWDDFGDGNREGDDDDEFFSPLVQHSAHTPSSKHRSADSHRRFFESSATLDFEADSVGDDVFERLGASRSAMPCAEIPAPAESSAALIFNADSILFGGNSFEQLSLSQSVMPSTDIPVAAAAPTKTPSMDVRGTPPPAAAKSREQQAPATAPPPSFSNAAIAAATHPPESTADPANTTQSSSFHLHSALVSSLPSDALTVDFVRRCDDVETLEAVLRLLSDDGNVRGNDDGGSGGMGRRPARYPSLVRLVEKRLQRMGRAGTGPPAHGRSNGDRVGEEDAIPEEEPLQLHQEERPSPAGDATPKEETPLRPMESITVVAEPVGGSGAKANRNHRSVSPELSVTISHSSLDMNLSSVFALDDESYFWKQGTMDNVVAVIGKEERGEGQHRSLFGESENVAAKQSSQHRASQTDDDIHQRYEQLQAKLASTLTSNAKLTGEVDSLVNKNVGATRELSLQLQYATEQLSRLKVAAATEKDAEQEHIAELETINGDLDEQVRRLYEQLHQFRQTTGGADARRLQSELEGAAREKRTLGRELDELRSMYDKTQREAARLKLLLDGKGRAAEDGEGARSLRRIVESSQMANQALANALAVSEKDLAEANEAKERSARECDALRNRATKLEDKTAFLSSEVKGANKELESSRAYIDQLYADLQTKNDGPSPSKEMKADFEGRELEWMELERGYSRRIQELEGRAKLGGSSSDSKQQQHGVVSMDAYLLEVQQTRHYKSESTRNEQLVNDLQATVGDLREQLDGMMKTKRGEGGGKSLRALQTLKLKQVAVPPERNDENAAPSSDPRGQQHAAGERDPGAVTQHRQQRGKQLSRVAAVKAAGGRKGLSEQLKRARRF